MSVINETNTATLDLSLFGCPMHYIKAREALKQMALEQTILLNVNNGDAVDEVLNSLQHDGQLCEVLAADSLTTTIKVVKKNA